ncbi:hypothetical protein NDU88_006829 [Pleurodeles waltl]|uniref:Uncharacterized protein n=1 Tax=Pleurodeles waltl TaxID=8319 RepID=A0AAV7U1K3_PLEWA|nr:hypothetical protein NDU88_006825 [Pleurodeles waltl]KAJ1181626.1 hypothetical protein NDU88_006829 [Pleurodeles waltl]
MAVGGVGIPAAVQQAAPPWRIQWGGGTLAGARQWCRSDRGFTAAVGIPIGAPPACRRCSRGPPPWRSKTARVRMTTYVFSMVVMCHWDPASQDPSAHRFVAYMYVSLGPCHTGPQCS